MEFYILISVLCLVFGTHDVHVQAMSIDDIISKVEEDYKKKLEDSEEAVSTARTAGQEKLEDSEDAIRPRAAGQVQQERPVIPEWNEYSLPNRTESLVKLQSDMIITKEMYQKIINRTEELPQNRRKKRAAINDKSLLWKTKRISYKISDEYSTNITHKLTILEAMNHWEEYTCLKFVEAKVTDIDVIYFNKTEGECYSYVGRIGGFQPINLDLQCMTKSVLIHEIGHAIGFFHEHMRADRDQYVFVNYKNIDESKHSQFDPLKEYEYHDFNKPYDYYSVMHYGKTYFSKDKKAGLVTMKPKNPTFLDIIGNSPSLSYHDMKLANDLYSCSARCPVKTCDGFVGGSNCECFCQYDNEFDVRLCAQEPCVLNYDVDTYIIHYDGDVAKNGKVIPRDKEVNVTCRHGRKDELPYTIGCFEWGWDYELEELNCVVQKVCPMVANATMTGSYEKGFKIECIPRHAIVTDGQVPDLFHCNRDGQWQPFTPICDPKNCTVPADKVERFITDTNGVDLNPGDTVAHGTEVNLRCPKSYVPEYESYKCSYGAYDTPDGNIPNCRQVTCDQPPVVNTKYRPKKGKYFFGDEIELNRCQGKTYLEGDTSLTCTQQGTWSGRAECVTFCPSNTDGYATHKNTIIMAAAKQRSYSTKVITHTYCQDLCTNSWKKRKGRYKRRLCGGYVFGYNGKYYECTLYYQRPEDLIAQKEYKPLMTLGIRKCL